MAFEVDPQLTALADELGVATRFTDWKGDPVDVDHEVVVETLAALGIDGGDPAAALSAVRADRADRLLPPTVIATEGEARPLSLEAPSGELTLALEDGGSLGWPFTASSGRELPDDLPAGWHRLRVRSGGRTAEATLVVVPPRLPVLGDDERLWGWQVQLYQLRSAGSWGIGDYADLRTLAEWSGAQGAGALLVNPLHAMTPLVPLEVSPYYPSSRLFRNALYLRVEQTPEYAAAPAGIRQQIDDIAARMRATNRSERLDRDAVWSAKAEALELLFPLSHADSRSGVVAEFRECRGDGLRDFATYCVLAELHGRDWRKWPVELRRPDGPAVAAERSRLNDRVEFHAWLQLLCDEQLAAAHDAALASGMRVGVIHDLAVGVDPGGADAWALQDALAVTTTVGAPPDSFNQQGQDWQLPPWRPDRLAKLGYAPFRDVVRAVLRHCGGLRIDHILGLFRLYWIPAGEPASRGTYVSYDDEALLGILVLEAKRAGALVVGEDLGTVAPRVTSTLHSLGVLGSDLLWFARDDRGPFPPERYRALAAASISTHDLPTARGFFAAEHVRIRDEVGVLGRPAAEEYAQARHEAAQLREFAHDYGTVGDDDDLVVALHTVLGRTPARLVLASPSDIVGDVRQPNLPGTTREYPNWRLPLADGSGRLLLLEDVMAAPMADRIAEALDRSRAREGGSIR